MARLAIEIGVVIVVYLIGYKTGQKHCYEFLMDQLEEEKKEKN